MRRRELGRRECLDLLTNANVGRVIFINRALPEVIPVCYVVAGETVVFGVHTSEPITLGLKEGLVVAFQVDAFDPEQESGWQVRALGCFRPPLTPDELAVTGVVAPQPWTTGATLERVLQLDLEVIEGWMVESPASGGEIQ